MTDVKMLPKDFLAGMKELLGKEYDQYIKSYEEEWKPGLRVNTLKLSPEEFLEFSMFFHIGYITVLLPYTDTKLPPSKVLHETLPRRFGGSLLPHPSSCLPGSGPHRSQKWASSLGGCGSSHPSALYDLLRHDRGPKRRSPAHKAPFPFFIPFYGPVPAGKLCLYHGPSMRIPHGSTDGQPFPGRRTD